MEITLQNIEFQLKSVVENAPFPIGIYSGREMNIILANKALIKTLGKGADIIGKSYFEILPELEGQGIFEKLLEVLRTGIAYEVKNNRVDLVINGQPTTHYFNYAFTPLHDSKGAVYGVMNTGVDVTDIVTARQQTQEAEEKLRIAVCSAELATYEIDLLNDDVTVSGNFRSTWDFDDEEVITKESIVSKLHPDDLHIRNAAFQSMGADGKVSYELRIVHRNNAIRWLRINGTTIKNDLGQPVVLVGIAQDITSQKKSEEYLAELVEQRTAQLQRSNDDLLQFSHIVSHDLKEPVRKIMIYNKMLKDTDDQRQRALCIGKIEAASNRMVTLIDGILAYSGTNAAGFPVEMVDLNGLMKLIKKDLELLIDEKKAIFIETHLPSVEGSPILLQRLFYNLVNNALKFSKADVPPRVTISSVIGTKDSQGYVRIIIEDNGIGIDPLYSDKIFNAFERLHSKDKYEGTGLGLALCKKIAERHKGSIESIGKDDGSEFAVELPLQQEGDYI